MKEGYVPPLKKSKRKGQSTDQNGHNDQTDQSTSALRRSEDDENRLENNAVKVRNKFMLKSVIGH